MLGTAYIANTDVKAYLGITGTKYDTILTSICTKVNEIVQIETGYVFNATAVEVADEITDYRFKNEIVTKYNPIDGLTKIEYKDWNGDWNEYTDEAVADIDFDAKSGRIFLLYKMTGQGKRNVRLTYDCANNSMAEDLKLACLLMANKLFNTRHYEGFLSQSLLGVTASLDKTDNKLVNSVLAKYKPITVL